MNWGLENLLTREIVKSQGWGDKECANKSGAHCRSDKCTEGLSRGGWGKGEEIEWKKKRKKKREEKKQKEE